MKNKEKGNEITWYFYILISLPKCLRDRVRNELKGTVKLLQEAPK